MNESPYLINFIYNNFLNIVIIILVILFILIVFNVYDINFENAFSKNLSKSFKLEAFNVYTTPQQEYDALILVETRARTAKDSAAAAAAAGQRGVEKFTTSKEERDQLRFNAWRSTVILLEATKAREKFPGQSTLATSPNSPDKSHLIDEVYKCNNSVGYSIDSCNLYDKSADCIGGSDCSWNVMKSPHCLSKFYVPS